MNNAKVSIAIARHFSHSEIGNSRQRRRLRRKVFNELRHSFRSALYFNGDTGRSVADRSGQTLLGCQTVYVRPESDALNDS
jgi:hypothetical protein